MKEPNQNLRAKFLVKLLVMYPSLERGLLKIASGHVFDLAAGRWEPCIDDAVFDKWVANCRLSRPAFKRSAPRKPYRPAWLGELARQYLPQRAGWPRDDMHAHFGLDWDYFRSGFARYYGGGAVEPFHVDGWACNLETHAHFKTRVKAALADYMKDVTARAPAQIRNAEGKPTKQQTLSLDKRLEIAIRYLRETSPKELMIKKLVKTADEPNSITKAILARLD